MEEEGFRSWGEDPGAACMDSLSPRAADEVSGNMIPLVAGVRGNGVHDQKRS